MRVSLRFRVPAREKQRGDHRHELERNVEIVLEQIDEPLSTTAQEDRRFGRDEVVPPSLVRERLQSAEHVARADNLDLLPLVPPELQLPLYAEEGRRRRLAR